MKKGAFLKPWLLLSGIWTGILLLPAGRSWWLDTMSGELGFYVIVWISGLALFAMQIKWWQVYGYQLSGWAKVIIIQLVLALVVAGSYHFFSTQTLAFTRSIDLPNGEWQALEPGPTALFSSGNAFSVFYLYLIHAGLGLLGVYQQKLREKENRETALQAQLAELTEPKALTNNRFVVKTGNKQEFVDYIEISYITADGSYAALMCQNGRKLLYRETITRLAEILKPYGFVRVHHSAIVATAQIKGVQSLGFGNIGLIMQDGELVRVSRKYKEEVGALL